MPAIYIMNNKGICSSYLLEVKRINDFFVCNGWDVVDTPEAADLLMVATCNAFEPDEEEAIENLQAMQQYGKPVVAYGCLVTYNPERVASVHNGMVIPTMETERLETLIPDLKVPLKAVPHPSTFRMPGDYRNYDLRRRFVNINFGCFFTCSFCPHKPGIGNLRSRPLAEIVEQMRALSQEDVRIVMLNGEDTGSYGLDIGLSYPEMLQAILEVEADYELHIHQFHPAWAVKYHERLIPLLCHPRITHIQIPIQTTSNRLLKLMRRPRHMDKLAAFLSELRAQNPKILIRTDLIVGFPTETMEELEASVEFVNRYFDEAAVYAFEMKVGVPMQAYNLEEFPREEKQRRAIYATEKLNQSGRITHRGGQILSTLVDVETQREQLRQARQFYTTMTPRCS